MRFQSRQQRPLYLNTKAQLRLLWMVGLLAMVLIAIKVSSNPEFWTGMFPDQAVQQSSQPVQDRLTLKDVDFNVQLEDVSELAPGEFLSRIQTAQPASASRTSERPKNDSSGAVEIGAAGDGLSALNLSALKIDERTLGSIQDNSLGIRRGESDAYYSILARARDLPQSRLEKVAERNVAFAVLMVHPEHYRGRLITVEGELKRLLPLTAGSNEHGLEDLWEGWLLTPDSPTNPYRIVSVEISDKIPRGEAIQQRVKVRVTGYFFKKEGYASRGGLHVAPLLLAKQIRWFPPQPGRLEEHDAGAAPYVVGLICVIVAGLGLLLRRFFTSQHSVRISHLKRHSKLPREVIDALSDVETTDVNNLFREMTEQV